MVLEETALINHLWAIKIKLVVFYSTQPSLGLANEHGIGANQCEQLVFRQRR